MRKTTKECVRAFYDDRSITIGNTKVTFDTDGSTIMKLHGNIIAVKHDNELIISSAGWQTNTTKERLNGVLSCTSFGIYQKKGIWYLTDYTQSEKQDVEFYDGMVIKL